MAAYIARRLVAVPATLLFATLVVFLLLHLSGDAVGLLLPQEATAEQRAALAEELGLNDPLPVQYGRFIANAIRGDLGQSHFYQRPAMEVILERLPATLTLAATGMLLAIVIGIGFGILAAIHPRSWLDSAIVSMSVFGQSMPSFWLGIMLMILLAVNLRLLPTSGGGSLQHLVLPAITLAAYQTPQILLLTRAAMLETFRRPFVTVARAKGLTDGLVTRRHALRNAINPVVASIGLQFGTLIGGSVITETVFAWPGVGRLSVQAIFNRDVPLVEACVLVLALAVLLSNLLVDVLNAVIDPRIRLSS